MRDLKGRPVQIPTKRNQQRFERRAGTLPTYTNTNEAKSADDFEACKKRVSVDFFRAMRYNEVSNTRF
jgi:hypothetical protein